MFQSPPTETPEQRFREQGFFIVPEVLIAENLLRPALAAVELVRDGVYDTGCAPWRTWNVGHSTKMQKIDMVHLCNRSLFELSTHPAIGEWAAKVTGASEIQLWAVQLFYKPPQGGALGNIGWHRDQPNWLFWEGEVFTAWLSLDEVHADSGPLRFVEGSHRWERQQAGDAYLQNLDDLRAEILRDSSDPSDWKETAALLPAGGLSFHHRRLLHGSGPNRSLKPRCSLGILLRTPQSSIIQSKDLFGFRSHLKDPSICPVIYRASAES